MPIATSTVVPDFVLQEGFCCPLGATRLASLRAYNFALYSEQTTVVTLLLFRNPEDPLPLLSVPLRHPAFKSLRYRATEMHVDGFRFDLASIFSRNRDGNLNLEDPPIIAEITSDPALMYRRLIAEAWEPATYQLGQSFPGITSREWNGRFRDDILSFVRGDSGMVNRVMTRMYGRGDLFPDTLRVTYRPYQSVNFVTAHDGFCLYDLVSYNQKHNVANVYANQDGIEDNRSWNRGWEGDDGVPEEVHRLRLRQARNLCCMLLLSQGTPMWLAGDEFLHTQGGNNNPYNQDNETTWLDWSRQQVNGDFYRFVRRMITWRRNHRYWGAPAFGATV